MNLAQPHPRGGVPGAQGPGTRASHLSLALPLGRRGRAWGSRFARPPRLPASARARPVPRLSLPRPWGGGPSCSLLPGPPSQAWLQLPPPSGPQQAQGFMPFPSSVHGGPRMTRGC